MPAPLPSLWLCLHLPQLGLDALGPPPPGLHLPLIVWHTEPGRRERRVHQADAAARALGVAVGQPLSLAQALLSPPAPQGAGSEGHTPQGAGSERRPPQGAGSDRHTPEGTGSDDRGPAGLSWKAPSAADPAPGALVLRRDPAREAALLDLLALALGAFTPQISPSGDDLLLGLHGSLRLFGGLRPLLRRLAEATRAAGVTRVRWGLAPTPLAAQLLAHGPGRRRRCLRPATAARLLQPLPVALLGRFGLAADTRAAVLEMLQALGVQWVADLLNLPRAGLRRRGAGDWLDALDRALGDAPDPRPVIEAPERFELSLDLAWRADSVGAVEAAVQPLLQALAGWLALRWQAAQRLRLTLRPEYSHRRGLPPQTLAFDLAQPSRDPALLRTLLREHLQHLVLAAPIDALTLTLDLALPDAGRATSLFPEAADTGEQHRDLATLIDRLQARLGAERVRRLLPVADARPERGNRWVGADTAVAAPATPSSRSRRRPTLPRGASRSAAPPAAAGSDRPSAAPAPRPTPPRPTWLLPVPQALAERDGRPQLDGQPLRLLTRAERIETGWHDDALVRRDYHVALGADARLCWVYLQRDDAVGPSRGAATGPAAGLAAGPPARWFLHGLFG